MSTLLQDLRYATRRLFKNPGFTAVAILTLALGVGANTAVFSMVYGVLLRPLPYPQPTELVQLGNHWQGTPHAALSPAEFFDYRDGLRGVESVGAYAAGVVNLTGTQNPEQLRAAYLTAGVFPTLGVHPAVGRIFTAGEDQPGNDAVVVLSYGLWQRRFGGDPAVVGQRVLLDGSARTVVGVMPASFRLPSDLAGDEEAQAYLPLGMDRASITERGSHFLNAVARLRPGVTTERVGREMAALAAGFVRDYPDDYPAEMEFGAGARPLSDAVFGAVRPMLLLLLGAVGLVLLIACANVANLLLVRAEGRRREMAVRRALGARTGRIVQQLLIESAVLAGLGGAAGIVLAAWIAAAIPHFYPPHLPRVDAIHLDGPVLAFSVAVSLVTALLFGLAPALHAARAGLERVLREGGRSGTGRAGMRGALVAVEVALAVVLMVGAGLLVRSFINLNRVDPGFRTEGVLTMRLTLPATSYESDERVVGTWRQLVNEVGALPGVSDAGAVTSLPLASSLGDLNFRIEGRPLAETDVSPRADWQAVTPGYFSAVGMQLLRGRRILPSDDENAPGVMVISESLARRYWPNEDPLGQRVELGGGAGPGWVTIVGIVRDVRHEALSADPEPEMYLAHAQFRFWNGGGAARSLALVARTPGDAHALLAPVRDVVRQIDSSLPIAQVHTFAEVRSESVARPRFATLLLGGFAALALLLAAIGIYATLAFLVAQRARELGIRMALGARATEIVTLVVRQGMAMALLGAAIGLAAAFALSRLLDRLLFGVAATDATTFILAPLGLALVALLACWIPAHRATRVDPVVALRAE